MNPEVLLETLEDLTDDEFKKFKRYLQQLGNEDEYPPTKRSMLEWADRRDIVNLMVNTSNIHGALKETKKILMKLNRSDLVHQLDISSGAEDQSKHPQKILSTKDSDPENILMSIRTDFIERVSGPTLDMLLDKLYESEIINNDEMGSVKSQNCKVEKAQRVIDMVGSKGKDASAVFVYALFEVDPCLSTELRLPDPGPARRARTRMGRSYRSITHWSFGFFLATGLALVAAILVSRNRK